MGPWPGRRQGNVLLRVEPRDARVYVNGTRRRVDGRATLRLPDGPCRLAFARPGYRTETLDLNVSPGVAYRVERHLSRLRGGGATRLAAYRPGADNSPGPLLARSDPPAMRVTPGFGTRPAAPSIPAAPRVTVPAVPPVRTAPPPRVTPGFGTRPAPPVRVPAPPAMVPVPPPTGTAPPLTRPRPGFGIRPAPVPPTPRPAPGGQAQPPGGERGRRDRGGRRILVPAPYYDYYGAPYYYPYPGYGYDRYGNPIGPGSPYYDYAYPGPQYQYPLVQTGELSIDIRPDDARVYLDGHLLGLAGEVRHLAALRSVLAGPHVVTVELPGYVTLRRDVVVDPGHRVRVRATLKRES
jgi:hypothetical protein